MKPDDNSMILPPNLHIVRHPLAQHKMTLIRDKSTGPKEFRDLVSETTLLIAVEATRDLPLKKVEIESPLAKTTGQVFDGKKVVVIPILRAGLAMISGLTNLIPNARIGHVGIERNHETHKPIDYYFKVPTKTEDKIFIVIDPMLAIGGTAITTVDKLKNLGAKPIKFICLIAAPEGLDAFSDRHRDVNVYTAVLYEKLNSQKFIVPGLGDAVDRLFGTEYFFLTIFPHNRNLLFY